MYDRVDTHQANYPRPRYDPWPLHVTGTDLQNNLLKTTAAMALVLSGAMTLIDVRTAGAYTLMDMMRGRVNNQQQQIIGGGMPEQPEAAIKNALRDAEPRAELPKVTGPRYYTFKADATRQISAGAFVNSTAVPTDQRRLLSEAKVSASPEVAKAIEDYYAGNGALLWVSGTEITEQARAVIALLADAGSLGLDPADYAIKVPALLTSSVAVDAPATEVAQVQTGAAPAAAPAGNSYDRDLMNFELALSAKVLTYVQDTVRGRVDPNKISGYHDFKRKTVELAPVLLAMKDTPDVGAYLASRSPTSAHFQQLKAELAKLKAQSAGGEQTVAISDKLLLKPGNSSPEMAGIVKAIQLHGSDALKVKHSVTLAGYQQTPEYTPELVAMVESFQQEHGLKADGVIGRSTVRAMVGESNSDKISKLIVALEQSRWLPDDLSQRYVFINQPAFTVSYYNNGQQELDMRVVVGAKAHQTYFFQDEIETVELNPSWGVPQSIIINEMLPKLRADPSYLDRMGYQVEIGGKKVASAGVNWFGSTNAISVRQPPSDDNALGELKILFPNAHAIYMHDTPSKGFFKRDMRALSHGCVRLADPRAMAAAVLGTTKDDIGAQIATGQNKAIKVPVKIPVYVSYFTAWPNKDGVVQYFDDVYDRDAQTLKALEVTSKARAV